MAAKNAPSEARGHIKQTDLFVSGEEGCHTYRIPALAVSTAGTLLAFCEGRKYARGDATEIHLLLRRSFDGGATWGETQLLVADGDKTCGNPAPVVDRRDGTIYLPFCKNLYEQGLGLIVRGEAPRTVWLTRSTDDGANWSEPEEITSDVKDPSWTWYATGPCHGIQIASGRLVIPCDHVVGVHPDRDTCFFHSHVITSDDGGRTWRMGGSAGEGTNESAVVETADGTLYLNCRNYRDTARNHRAYAWSSDGGETFPDLAWDESLIEPICQGSLARFTDVDRHDKNRVLFSNPASTERERLTVRISYDECRTWAASRTLHEGPAAYSDLAVTEDMTICCLYENGDHGPYERLTLARFDVGWLTHGADRLQTSPS